VATFVATEEPRGEAWAEAREAGPSRRLAARVVSLVIDASIWVSVSIPDDAHHNVTREFVVVPDARLWRKALGTSTARAVRGADAVYVTLAES
jgi:hypothetical protein